MIRIIVCDDDLFTLKLSEKLLKQAILESRADAAVVCVSDCSSMFRYFIYARTIFFGSGSFSINPNACIPLFKISSPLSVWLVTNTSFASWSFS